MATLVPVTNDALRDVKINTARSAALGDDVHFVLAVAGELANLVTHYPVFFTKDANSGQFRMVAMLGFEKGENLFLQHPDWQNQYIPLDLRRQPFQVSRTAENGQAANEGVLVLDTDSPRVSKTDGEPLFGPDSKPTAFLSQISAMMSEFMGAAALTDTFIAALLEHSLLAPANLSVPIGAPDSGSQAVSIEGLYGIDQTILRQLSGDSLEALNGRGFLQACYFLMASQGNLKTLIALKNSAMMV